MSEHNQIKQRKCPRCNEIILGKASKLKKHAKAHIPEEREAAGQALMEKMQAELLSDEAKISQGS